jgi:hypothetical protein
MHGVADRVVARHKRSSSVSSTSMIRDTGDSVTAAAIRFPRLRRRRSTRRQAVVGINTGSRGRPGVLVQL